MNRRKPRVTCTLCEQTVEFLIVKREGTQNNSHHLKVKRAVVPAVKSECVQTRKPKAQSDITRLS